MTIPLFRSNRFCNFNAVAAIYDPLAFIVFGRSIRRIQTDLLSVLPMHAKVLIIGGGTGWIINELFEKCSVSELVYVEASSSMISKAKENTALKWLSKTHFVHGTELDVPNKGEQFDAVLTFFLFDLFEPVTQEKAVKAIAPLLKSKGSWLWADFTSTTSWYQQALTRLMYFFFRLSCGIEANRLYDVNPYFEQIGMMKENERSRLKGWLKTKSYRKP